MGVKEDIKKLVKEMETNQLLEYELSGYLSTKEKRDLFRDQAKHITTEKKKYTYIDQGDGGSQRSGKFLVQNEDDKTAQKGYVWGIRAYGQKGRPVGDLKKVIREFQEGNENLSKMVMERSRKRRAKKPYVSIYRYNRYVSGV